MWRMFLFKYRGNMELNLLIYLVKLNNYVLKIIYLDFRNHFTKLVKNYLKKLEYKIKMFVKKCFAYLQQTDNYTRPISTVNFLTQSYKVYAHTFVLVLSRIFGRPQLF